MVNHRDYNKLIKAVDDCGVTTKEFLSIVGLLTDAMLKSMAIEMIKWGYCLLPSGKRLYLEDAGERFLEIYNKLLLEKGE